MSHPLAEQEKNYPQIVEKKYLRRIFPPLSVRYLLLELLLGEKRDKIQNVLLTGDSTLLLTYKSYAIGIISYLTDESFDLQIAQFQGAKSRKSYRGYSGAHVTEIFADHSVLIAQRSDQIERITMPSIPEIIDGTPGQHVESTVKLYNHLVKLMLLGWSKDEKKFIRDM